MENKYAEIIRKKYDSLVRSLDPDGGLLNALWSKGIHVNGDDAPTADDKNEKILRTMCGLQTADVETFIALLRQRSQGHVADLFDSQLPGMSRLSYNSR